MATFIVQAVTIYLGLGAGIALVFLLWGIDRIDPAAQGSYAFRPLLFPGLVLLWPLVILRWRTLERARP
ncbi:MAG: hypothetical protein AB7F35_04555 [Acetobacteraceae bacterium]